MPKKVMLVKNVTVIWLDVMNLLNHKSFHDRFGKFHELFFVSVFFQKNLNFYFFNSKNYGEIFWLDGLLKNMLKFEVPGL